MISRIRKMIDDREAGFTLIELLVVIIIIGILAAIAIPVFLNQRKKGFNAGIKSDLRTVANEMESAYTDNPTSYVIPAANVVKKSPGDVLEVKITAAGDAFCVRGSNPKSDASGGSFYYYDSQNGGIQSVPAAAAPPAAATTCAAAGAFNPVP